MSRRLLLALACTSLVLSPNAVRAADKAATETVQADSARATPGGTTFMVPAGWTMTTKGSMVILDPPEPDSHVAIVDVKAKDPNAAVTEAWAAYKPGFSRPLKISLPGGLGRADSLPVRDVAERARRGRRERAAGRECVDRRDPRGYRANVRKARRANRARPPEHPAEGVLTRAVHRQEGEPARREAPRHPQGFRRERDEDAGHAGRGARLHRRRQDRVGRRPRREGDGEVRPDRRRYTLHRGVEHEGADDASSRGAGRRGEDALGPACDRAVPGVQARRRSDDEAGPRSASHLRLHRDAETGYGMAARVPRRNSRVGGEAPGNDAAHEQVRGGLPVQQPDGRGRRLHRRLKGGPRKGMGAGLRRGDADEGLRASRDEDHDVRLRDRPEG